MHPLFSLRFLLERGLERAKGRVGGWIFLLFLVHSLVVAESPSTLGLGLELHVKIALRD